MASSFTNAAGGATMKSNQLFGPYGNNRYNAGSLNTAKGFIDQYNDGTGLDYFNARYYDPVAAVFLSADTVEGNAQGMNPYAYVNGNPETHSDPSGHFRAGCRQRRSRLGQPTQTHRAGLHPAAQHLYRLLCLRSVPRRDHGDALTGISSMVNDVKTVFNSNAGFLQKLGAIGDFALNMGMDVSMVLGAGELARGAELLFICRRTGGKWRAQPAR